MTKPKKPQLGFYYHYKHDKKLGLNNHAYEIIGIGLNTEKWTEYLVVYRPLYRESSSYKEGRLFCVRPLSIFLEKVTKNNKTFPRFKKIKDKQLIRKLIKIRNQMY